MKKKCVKIWVSGRVQGVCFRATTCEQANRLGLTGHAINLPDGRVEVLACGDGHGIDKLIAWLKQGPRWARVSGLQFETVEVSVPTSFNSG